MDITVDVSGLTAYLDDFQKRQVPFALANTLNDTAKLFQYREQQHIGKQFTVRRKEWVDRNVKITKFAKKNDLVATVAIESPGGGARSDVLGKFETQTKKTPIQGKSIAVPVEARRNKSDIITQANRPKAFNFKEISPSRFQHAHRVSKRLRKGIFAGGLKVFEGDRGTFMLKNPQGHGIILQRTRKGGKQAARVLFYLTPRVKLNPNLHFVENAKQAATHVAEFFKARFAEAMHTAR